MKFDGPTDGTTDGRTDKAGCRVACTRLKSTFVSILHSSYCNIWMAGACNLCFIPLFIDLCLSPTLCLFAEEGNKGQILIWKCSQAQGIWKSENAHGRIGLEWMQFSPLITIKVVYEWTSKTMFSWALTDNLFAALFIFFHIIFLHNLLLWIFENIKI